MCVQINVAVIGKNEQLEGFKVLIIRLHYITMYFTDTEFPNEESVMTQVFAFSRLKKQTSKLSS